MARTFHWHVIPGVIALAVHTDVAPSDEDWDACHQDIAAHLGNLRGLLIYSTSSGPTAAQRARSTATLKAANKDFQTVIMTASRVVRGMVTAFSWSLTGNVKAFSTHDLEGALDCFGLSDEERLSVRVSFKQLSRVAGTEIEAFADESGRFRAKYK